MKKTVIALAGFLGKPSDWDAVRAASKSGLHWVCPDLFGATDSFDPPQTDGPCWLAGYSFGARLALRWMNAAPDKWLGALLISANPGNFQTDSERASRRVADEKWAASFVSEPWDHLMERWNSQDIFLGSPAPLREECAFERVRLARALREYSVADQFTDPLRLPPRLVWLSGSRDTKFSGLQEKMRASGFPGSFLRVEDAGHRLLAGAPEAVAAALDDLTA